MQIEFIGSITLFDKEIKRFLKYINKRLLLLPTSLLFLLVINVAIEDRTAYKFNYIDFWGQD